MKGGFNSNVLFKMRPAFGHRCRRTSFVGRLIPQVQLNEQLILQPDHRHVELDEPAQRQIGRDPHGQSVQIAAETPGILCRVVGQADRDDDQQQAERPGDDGLVPQADDAGGVVGLVSEGSEHVTVPMLEGANVMTIL